MKHPKELSVAEIAEIALKVKYRLKQKFGEGMVTRVLSTPIGIALLKETYIAVREQLEK